MEKNWKKLDPEDSGTWPGDRDWCWIGDAEGSEASTFRCDWEYRRFFDLSMEAYHEFAEVLYWSPATPPPFDGE